jgi:hypothetical protein
MLPRSIGGPDGAALRGHLLAFEGKIGEALVLNERSDLCAKLVENRLCFLELNSVKRFILTRPRLQVTLDPIIVPNSTIYIS